MTFLIPFSILKYSIWYMNKICVRLPVNGRPLVDAFWGESKVTYTGFPLWELGSAPVTPTLFKGRLQFKCPYDTDYEQIEE